MIAAAAMLAAPLRAPPISQDRRRLEDAAGQPSGVCSAVSRAAGGRASGLAYTGIADIAGSPSAALHGAGADSTTATGSGTRSGPGLAGAGGTIGWLVPGVGFIRVVTDDRSSAAVGSSSVTDSVTAGARPLRAGGTPRSRAAADRSRSIRSSSSRAARAVAGRVSRRLAMSSRANASSSGSTSRCGTRLWIGGGSSSRLARATSAPLPSNGSRPDSIS
jgi:hypothetical protein